MAAGVQCMQVSEARGLPSAAEVDLWNRPLSWWQQTTTTNNDNNNNNNNNSNKQKLCEFHGQFALSLYELLFIHSKTLNFCCWTSIGKKLQFNGTFKTSYNKIIKQISSNRMLNKHIQLTRKKSRCWSCLSNPLGPTPHGHPPALRRGRSAALGPSPGNALGNPPKKNWNPLNKNPLKKVPVPFFEITFLSFPLLSFTFPLLFRTFPVLSFTFPLPFHSTSGLGGFKGKQTNNNKKS